MITNLLCTTQCVQKQSVILLQGYKVLLNNRQYEVRACLSKVDQVQYDQTSMLQMNQNNRHAISWQDGLIVFRLVVQYSYSIDGIGNIVWMPLPKNVEQTLHYLSFWAKVFNQVNIYINKLNKSKIKQILN